MHVFRSPVMSTTLSGLWVSCWFTVSDIVVNAVSLSALGGTNTTLTVILVNSRVLSDSSIPIIPSLPTIGHLVGREVRPVSGRVGVLVAEENRSGAHQHATLVLFLIIHKHMDTQPKSFAESVRNTKRPGSQTPAKRRAVDFFETIAGNRKYINLESVGEERIVDLSPFQIYDELEGVLGKDPHITKTLRGLLIEVRDRETEKKLLGVKNMAGVPQHFKRCGLTSGPIGCKEDVWVRGPHSEGSKE
ncbi:hypothetical protein ElyMa_006792000 [Elysia marginata]|uniref:Uncharacterized protein n=1 Tax=Elysia marginata TaxID=1093978 RepID=A0AAV4J0Q3_9GAST|nr:hypothetical protein ElyMa_006792000 [Elysia marginata]